jgi:hypothetical protein
MSELACSQRASQSPMIDFNGVINDGLHEHFHLSYSIFLFPSIHRSPAEGRVVAESL